jgi:AsmA-like C-terminal region
LLIGAAAAVLLIVAAGLIAARILSQRFEPYVREQAVEYLKNRFASDVELRSLHVRFPRMSPLRLLRTRGRGMITRVNGEGLTIRLHGRQDLPPIFTIRKFAFEIDPGKLFDTTRTVPLVTLDGVEISVPPRAERPVKQAASAPPSKEAGATPDAARRSVLIEKVVINNARLVTLPKDPKKIPLRFDIHRLELDSAGADAAMKYDARLTNPKPPGEIVSKGSFGPWAAEDPGDSPLAGDYVFEKADLGVFAGIAGILNSTGSFQGTLDAIKARGEARVPDFRLKMANNPVPLTTRFEVLVDGTNGNTVLQPVHATLGSTRFTTSGAVIKHEGDQRRTISLNVSMPDGAIRDLLRLAAKGPPFMEGRVALNTRIDIPPLSGKVREKLILDGRFELLDGKFLRSTIQDQIDSLSRRGQGAPDDTRIDEVVSYMTGDFRLENESLLFRSLTFGVPGAHVQLAGDYSLSNNALDLHGNLRLQSKVSGTVTGWKHWALKPVDPLFAKRGAGTFLNIKVDGTSEHPKFGLDRSADRARTP